MAEEDAASSIRSLVEGILFLSAVRTQLNGEFDTDVAAVSRYGRLVPSEDLGHLNVTEQMRVEEEQAAENGSRGLDDHSIRLTLGRRRAASVDRMLHRHNQLSAQDRIDQALP